MEYQYHQKEAPICGSTWTSSNLASRPGTNIKVWCNVEMERTGTLGHGAEFTGQMKTALFYTIPMVCIGLGGDSTRLISSGWPMQQNPLVVVQWWFRVASFTDENWTSLPCSGCLMPIVINRKYWTPLAILGIPKAEIVCFRWAQLVLHRFNWPNSLP